MQTSKFYASTCTYCGTASCAAILDVSWFAITDFQQKCFRGASEVSVPHTLSFYLCLYVYLPAYLLSDFACLSTGKRWLPRKQLCKEDPDMVSHFPMCLSPSCV